MISVMMGHEGYTYIQNRNDTKVDMKSPGGIMGKQKGKVYGCGEYAQNMICTCMKMLLCNTRT